MLLLFVDVNLQLFKLEKMKEKQIIRLLKVLPPTGGEDLGGAYE